MSRPRFTLLHEDHKVVHEAFYDDRGYSAHSVNNYRILMCGHTSTPDTRTKRMDSDVTCLSCIVCTHKSRT
jgi:hypothetical protein